MSLFSVPAPRDVFAPRTRHRHRRCPISINGMSGSGLPRTSFLEVLTALAQQLEATGTPYDLPEEAVPGRAPVARLYSPEPLGAVLAVVRSHYAPLMLYSATRWDDGIVETTLSPKALPDMPHPYAPNPATGRSFVDHIEALMDYIDAEGDGVVYSVQWLSTDQVQFAAPAPSRGEMIAVLEQAAAEPDAEFVVFRVPPLNPRHRGAGTVIVVQHDPIRDRGGR